MNEQEGLPSDGHLLKVIDGLIATDFIRRAQFDVLFSLVEALWDRAGVAQLEGMPMRAWFQREKREQLERMLIECEDLNPGVAAFVQREIDRHPDTSSPESEE
jgi:hypothetical protein